MQAAAQQVALEAERLAVALQSTLTTSEAASLDVKTLFALEQDLLNLADAIGLATIVGATYQIAFGLHLKDLTSSFRDNCRS